MTILGILAGWCNENTSGGAILVVLGYLYFIYKEKRPMKAWLFTGLGGAIFGLLMMVAAPGNAIRATYFDRSTWSFARKLYTGVFGITRTLYENSLQLFILTAILIALGIIFNQHKNWLRLSYVYILAGLATIYVLSLSPTGLNWGRSFFGGALYIIIAMLLEWPDKLSKSTSGSFYSVISSVLIIQFLFTFVIGVNGIVQSYRDINEQYRYVENQKKQGNLNPLIADFNANEGMPYPAYSSALSHVGANIDSQVNRSNAKYFGLETIRSVSKNAWNTIYKNGDPTLMNIWDYQEYLKELAESDHTVLISGAGTSQQMNESLATDIAKLLPELDLQQFTQGWNFSGIRQADQDPILSQNENYNAVGEEFAEKQVSMSSSFTPYEEQQFSRIKIDGTDVSRNKTGINIVVLSKDGKILDAVNILSTEQGVTVSR